jgi:elongation factor P
MRNIKTDSVLERTFRTAEKLDDVVLEEKELEFLYQSGNDYYFMDHTTYDQFPLSSERVGDTAKYLLENLVVAGLSYNDEIVKVMLPNFIVAQIVETEPGIRGDSSRSGNKPAKIQTGAVVQVPLFINSEDWIKIDTRSGEYVERVQK